MWVQVDPVSGHLDVIIKSHRADWERPTELRAGYVLGQISEGRSEPRSIAVGLDGHSRNSGKWSDPDNDGILSHVWIHALHTDKQLEYVGSVCIFFRIQS